MFAAVVVLAAVIGAGPAWTEISRDGFRVELPGKPTATVKGQPSAALGLRSAYVTAVGAESCRLEVTRSSDEVRSGSEAASETREGMETLAEQAHNELKNVQPFCLDGEQQGKCSGFDYELDAAGGVRQFGRVVEVGHVEVHFICTTSGGNESAFIAHMRRSFRVTAKRG